MKQKENILARADNFVGKHRVAFLLIMMAWVIGIFTGYLAITTGIQHGYWEKSGYYYMQSLENNNLTSNISYYGFTTYTYPDYSETAYVKASPAINKSKIIIFECFNSSLNLNNNQISCVK